jgi:hypothetical protein
MGTSKGLCGNDEESQVSLEDTRRLRTRLHHVALTGARRYNERNPVSIANVYRAFLDSDEAAFLEMASAATLHLTVDEHVSIAVGFLGVSAGVKQDSGPGVGEQGSLMRLSLRLNPGDVLWGWTSAVASVQEDVWEQRFVWSSRPGRILREVAQP